MSNTLYLLISETCNENEPGKALYAELTPINQIGETGLFDIDGEPDAFTVAQPVREGVLLNQPVNTIRFVIDKETCLRRFHIAPTDVWPLQVKCVNGALEGTGDIHLSFHGGNVSLPDLLGFTIRFDEVEGTEYILHNDSGHLVGRLDSEKSEYILFRESIAFIHKFSSRRSKQPFVTTPDYGQPASAY